MTEYPAVKNYTGTQADVIDESQGEDNDERIVNKVLAFKQKYIGDYNTLQKIAKKNRDYWRGNQINESDLYVGEDAIILNRIFTSIETIIPIATRRTPEPDVTVVPGKGKNLQLQEKLEVFLKDLWENELEIQSAMEEVLRNLMATRYGAVKYFYDQETSSFGITPIPMGKILFNYKATRLEDTPIIEFVEVTLGELKERFPDSIESIEKIPSLKNKEDSSTTEYIEYHENEFYACIYDQVLLYKGKNENWNWENPFGGEGSFNHHKKPEKPYLLINHLTWGDSLIDDTTLIEQAITLQDSANKRKRQTEQNAGMANGKIIAAGNRISKEDFDDIDNSPEQKIYLEGADTVEGAIRMEYGRALDVGLHQDMIHSIGEIDNVMGTHATTRGEHISQQTATGVVTLKESDAGRLEILTRRIEKFAQNLYGALIQMMYVHFDQQHPVHFHGKENNLKYLTAKEGEAYIIRDEFKDVKIRVLVQQGSTVPKDKVTQKAEAVDLTKNGLMSKKDMYTIMEYPNPETLARNAYLETTSPQTLYDPLGGEAWDIEAIRHTAAIVNSEYLEQEDIDIFESQDPSQYARHISTHQQYMSGAEIDPDLPTFEELDLDTKDAYIRHVEMEIAQAESIAEQLETQMGAEPADQLTTLQAENIEPTPPALEGSGQIAADVLAGGLPNPPAQALPPMI